MCSGWHFGGFVWLVFRLHCKCIPENISSGLGHHMAGVGEREACREIFLAWSFQNAKPKHCTNTSAWARAKKLKKSKKSTRKSYIFTSLGEALWMSCKRSVLQHATYNRTDNEINPFSLQPFHSSTGMLVFIIAELWNIKQQKSQCHCFFALKKSYNITWVPQVATYCTLKTTSFYRTSTLNLFCICNTHKAFCNNLTFQISLKYL